GTELWCSDGSVEGTGMLLDLSPGTGSGFGNTICALNGKAYFAGTNNFIGRELFVSSGFKGQTHLYVDIFPGINFGNIASIGSYNNMLYVSANTNDGKGVELYKIDPSAFLSTSNIQANNLAIWPNPVRAGSILGNIPEDVTYLTLYSSTGEMITLYRDTDKIFTLPNSLSSGIYVLSTGKQTLKLVIEQ
ncbi:MAG: T9SS type A sorting domain-containing protein, partial [Chitinophagaceae bacterium]